MEKNNKILVIKLIDDNVFFKNIKNIDRFFCCNPSNIFYRIFKKFKLPLYFFLGKWKKNVKNYNTFILFDGGYEDYICKYIKKKNPNAKIIFWYWNSVTEYHNKAIENELIDEIWTYNRFDAKKFDLKYNPQFYLKIKEFYNSNIVNDILFVGRDKGREKNINELELKLNELNVKTSFKLIKNANDMIDYDEYLNLLEQSKCVLDYSFTLPCGLSLRPLESLFYEKKLITNNTDIKNYDFYDSNNIFILGEDNIENIQDFINKPYKKIDEKIVKYYNYYSWLNRFGE